MYRNHLIQKNLTVHLKSIYSVLSTEAAKRLP